MVPLRQYLLPVTLLSFLWINPVTVSAYPLIHIEGQLQEIKANPTWLIVLRNLDTGSVVPWMYDFRDSFAHWMVSSEGHHYQIIRSELYFGDNTHLSNVCGIEDGIVSGKSLQIYLKGALTPKTDSFQCRVLSWSFG